MRKEKEQLTLMEVITALPDINSKRFLRLISKQSELKKNWLDHQRLY